MELLSIGLACLFMGYLLGRIQTQSKYDESLSNRKMVLFRRGQERKSNVNKQEAA